MATYRDFNTSFDHPLMTWDVFMGLWMLLGALLLVPLLPIDQPLELRGKPVAAINSAKAQHIADPSSPNCALMAMLHSTLQLHDVQNNLTYQSA